MKTNVSQLSQVARITRKYPSRVLLASIARKELYWLLAHKEWVGLLNGYQFQPACLVLRDHTCVPTRTTILHEGGRLSAALLTAHAAEIDVFFGASVSILLHPRKTVVSAREKR